MTAQPRDEVASLWKHVEEVEDAENDFKVCREQQLCKMLDGVVQMSRKAVLDEERCEIKDEEEKLATLKAKGNFINYSIITLSRLAYLLKLRWVAHDVDLIVLIVRRLL